jgi:hypothetical protein
MSTIKVNKIENTSTTAGGVAIDSSGHVQVDGLQMPSAGALSNRNLIINGAMNVAQRGTSETGLTSGNNFILDRFRVYINSIGTYTISQAADAPAGFKYSYKVDCTTADASPAAADEMVFAYPFEGQDLQHLKKGTSGAEKVTLSFWVKSNKTTSGQVNFRDIENTRIIAATYTINAADTWEYKTITFAGDTTGTLTADNGARMQVQWFLDSGSNSSSGATPTAWEAEVTADKNATNFGLASSTDNYWQITGVQLEVGEKATPFEHRSYGDELGRCQRYYKEVLAMNSSSNSTFFDSYFGGSTAVRVLDVGIDLMRISPNLAIKNSDNSAQYYSYTGTWTNSTVTASALGAFPHRQLFLYMSADGDGRGKLCRRDDGTGGLGVMITTLNAEL